eukprot:3077473-Alexandrium_andersonii.AAC.1
MGAAAGRLSIKETPDSQTRLQNRQGIPATAKSTTSPATSFSHNCASEGQDLRADTSVAKSCPWSALRCRARGRDTLMQAAAR